MPSSPDAKEKVTLRTILRDPVVGPIIGIVFVFLAGLGLVVPTLPLFARSFGVGNDGAGLFIASFGFARLLGDLIAGSIIHRKGERWSATVGMGFLAVCSLATGAAPNFVTAVALWGLAGIGSAIVFASLFSYILQAAPKDRVGRTLSFFFGAFNVGIIAGGAAGGFIAGEFGLEAPLYAYSAVLVAAILLYLRFVPRLPASRAQTNVADEPSSTSTSNGKSHIVRNLLRVPAFRTALFLNLTYLWIVGAIFNTLLPLFATDELGMSASGVGAVFAIGVGAELLVLFPAGTLTDSTGRRSVMLPSLVGLVVTILLMGWAGSPLALALIVALLAMSSGFAGVPPAAILSDVVPPQQSGPAVGAFRFFGDIGFFLGPLITGAASKNFGFETAFAITATVPAVAFLLTLRTKETLARTS